jgi:predicted ATPase
MIKQIQIKNFKSHIDTTLDMAPLTLLTGLNGMGKSSVIQALLLLRQSSNTFHMGLMLNGYLCKIGSAQDAISTNSEDDFIDITISFDNDRLHRRYMVYPDQLSIDFLPWDRSAEGNWDGFDSISLFNSHFQYISVHRNLFIHKPVNTTYHVDVLNQISDEEGRAEYVEPYILKHGNSKIAIPALKHPQCDDLSLKAQIEAWLREFSPNINLHIERVDANSYKTEYSFNREDGRVTPRFKSENVGFGITYDLPLLAVILNARPGDLIIIENPEAHIHPAGQATLIRLMAIAAEAGVQFILETHSDHIINGALVSVKQKNISHNNVSICYFDRDETRHASKVIPVDVKESGRIYKPPKGFFDQIKIDMEYIMGF